MQFSQIIGLEDVKQKLISAVKNNHVAHAQLFLGGEGGANLSLALAYVTYLNCMNPQEQDSCGKCGSCKKIAKLIHPDLHFVFPTATTKSITKREDAVSSSFLKEWRSFLINNAYPTLPEWSATLETENKQCMIPVQEGRNIIKSLALKAFEANYKAMIIWLPELMNISAANAILKILEEPPEQTIFVLVSNSLDKMLATILSRTQLVVIRTFSEEEITNYLVHYQAVEADRASQIATLCEGNVNEAIRLSKEAKQDNLEYFRTWMALCYKSDYTNLVKETEKFVELGKESQKSLFQYGLNVFRTAFGSKFGKHIHAKTEGADFIKGFSKVINEKNLEIMTNLLNDAFHHLERNASPRILFLDLSLQMSKAIKMKVEEMI
ncbi:MAG: DNA polymerase III subunit delta [Bacteroidetes bacterium]|nr:MAG: DNA polymerase III subunit delta [Bacteroidota bacterium]